MEEKPINRFKKGVSLRIKFIGGFTLFIIFVIGIITLYFITSEKKALSEEIKLRGEAICKNVAGNAEDPLIARDDAPLFTFVDDAKRNNKGVIYCFITDEKDKIWAHTDRKMVETIYKPPDGIKNLKQESMLVQSYNAGGIPCYDIAASIKAMKVKLGAVHLGISRQSITESIKKATKGIVWVAVIVIFAGIGSVFMLVSFIIGSLGEITDGIVEIGNGNLDRRVRIARRDEIGRIAYVVNNMAVKLKRAQAELVEKERMKKEMQIARNIQQRLLPDEIPSIEGIEIGHHYQSAMEVGGDYYDFIEISPDLLGIVIADVSGKGIGGSLVMTMAKTILHIVSPENKNVIDIVSSLNKTISEQIPEGMFITLLYSILNKNTKELFVSSAGHTPLLLVRDDKIIRIKPQGIPVGLGIFSREDYAKNLKKERYKLVSGDLLFLYTDGITEAMNPQQELFGEDRLVNFLMANKDKNAGEVKKSLIKNIEEFTSGAPQSDDITFIILKIL